MQVLLQDIRYGARMLVKKPSFTLIAIFTLALGIGGNTAIFSVIHAVLLRSLPYHNSDRLVALWATSGGAERELMSPREIQQFQTQSQNLEDLTGAISQSVNLTGTERPDRVRGTFVTANFFQVFNLTPIIGRTFAPGEDQPGAEKLAVINEKLWRERLDSNPDLTGKKLILNGEPYSVIGVITSDFQQPLDTDVQVWMAAPFFPGNTGQPESRFLFGLGHLKPGVDLKQTQVEVKTIANQLELAHPKENTGRGANIEYLHELTVGSIRPMLLLLFGSVGIILLIACANVANLLLARGLARQKEIAVRAALGASKWRLIRQLLTESTLLGLAGGICGLLLAQWGLYGLLKLPQTFVRADDVTISTLVLVFTLVVAVLTGWLFGLAPALQFARPDLQTALKEGGRGGNEGTKWNRVRGTFVIAQIALSLMLLVGGGLLIRSFYKLLKVDLGFKPENLLTLEYRLPRNKYQQDEAQWNFHRQVMARIQEIPGVESVALVRGLPFSGNGATTGIILPDREVPAKGKEPQVMFNTATPEYFETLGIPLLRGRLFNNLDQLKTPTVFLINQTMARRFWPDEDSIGKQVKLAEDGTTGTIVGIVGDTKHYYLEEESNPQMYNAYSQAPGYFATVAVRTRVEPMSLAEDVRKAVWQVDSDQPMWKVRTLEFLLDRNVADKRFVMTLMSGFAVLALILTVIGLYGVMSYSISQQRQEIGLRMALGAQAHDILQMILRQGMRLTLVGGIIGIAGSYALTQLLQSLVFGVDATDLVTFGGVTLLLSLVAMIACYIPARRAAKVDPMVALRYE